MTDLSAIRESRNDVLFQTADARVLTDEQVGGFGRDLIDERDNKARPRLAAARLEATTPFKGGVEWNRSDNFRDTLYVEQRRRHDAGRQVSRRRHHRGADRRAAAGPACSSTSRRPATSTA